MKQVHLPLRAACQARSANGWFSRRPSRGGAVSHTGGVRWDADSRRIASQILQARGLNWSRLDSFRWLTVRSILQGHLRLFAPDTPRESGNSASPVTSRSTIYAPHPRFSNLKTLKRPRESWSHKGVSMLDDILTRDTLLFRFYDIVIKVLSKH